jgi:hypothetical protein
MMEILSGARDDQREHDLRRLLLRFHLHRFDAVVDFDGTIRIYRRCRQQGITPRGLVDCMIAAVAWREGATLHQLAKVCRVTAQQRCWREHASQELAPGSKAKTWVKRMLFPDGSRNDVSIP